MKKNIPNNIVNQAVDEYFSSKKSLIEIGKKYNLSGGSIRYYIIKKGLKPRTNGEHKYSHDRVVLCTEFYESGLFTVVELAKMFKVCRRTVADWAKSLGVKPRTQLVVLGIDDELRNRAIDMYLNEKLTCVEVGKILNVSSHSVGVWVGKDYMRSQSVMRIMNNIKYGSYTKGVFGWIECRFGRMCYDSSYERDRIIQLEKNENILAVSRCRDAIPYVDAEGKLRNYNPDLLVKSKNEIDVVEEIKPFCMIPKMNNPSKIQAATIFYKNKNINYKIITENEIYPKI